jgi:hypothetical protein
VTRKWARRHRPVVLSAAAGLLVGLGVLAGSVGWVVRDRAARQARAAGEARAALREAHEFRREGKWARARAAAERAEAHLAGGGSEEVWRDVRELRADLDMVVKLEEARLLGSGVRHGYFDSEGPARRYAEAFRGYGIDVEELDPREAAQRIGARAIVVELAAALDGWAQRRFWAPHKGKKGWRELLVLARDADRDPWRTGLRNAVLQGKSRALVERARSAEVRALPPVTLVLLAEHLAEMGRLREATTLLRRAQGEHPATSGSTTPWPTTSSAGPRRGGGRPSPSTRRPWRCGPGVPGRVSTWATPSSASAGTRRGSPPTAAPPS